MQEQRMRRVLTIAGSDPSAGAGIQLDLKVFEKLGIYGTSVIASVTAQNTLGVQKVYKLPQTIIAAQIDSVMCDIGTDACKIGMLLSHQAVETVAERVHRRQIPNVVLDPVIAAKDGTTLLSATGVKRMKRFLIPRVLMVTPNVPEAEILSGVKIKSPADLKSAANAILDMGVPWVLVKGGHLEGTPVDTLFGEGLQAEFPGERIEGRPVHGTGCALSAAIAARIAMGDDVPAASEFAKDFVAGLIKNAKKIGRGNLIIR
jgi:hydroxymethylpyrimidine/phosphomethylpyrimidine kinase